MNAFQLANIAAEGLNAEQIRVAAGVYREASAKLIEGSQIARKMGSVAAILDDMADSVERAAQTAGCSAWLSEDCREAMRSWILECDFPDLQDDDDLTNGAVWLGVERHFDGGVAGFLACYEPAQAPANNAIEPRTEEANRAAAL